MQSGLSLKPTNLPSQELAFTNCTYASEADCAELGGERPGAPLYVDIKGCVFTLKPHPKMEAGTIALNKVQREWARVGLNMDLFVKRYVPPAGSDLGSCSLEVDFLMKPASSDNSKVEVDGDKLEEIFRERFGSQVLTTNQTIALDYDSHLLKFVVLGLQGLDLGDSQAAAKLSCGLINAQTQMELKQGSSGKLHVLSSKVTQRSIFRPDFNFEELGIGGLSKEFGDVFRRAFASRVFPPHIARDLGVNHAKGMLLYGPPGTGKTLMARQIAKFLKAAEPKIVNGPEILNKYVGQSEENIRELFKDAEAEYKSQGEHSQLHIIIFDEIDAICKSRGSSRDSTGVSDSIVNQLLSKIDGVDSLNNILLIGMTNRRDLIDDALLRPGRLEVHIEISLPNEAGRLEIFNIHTANMRKKGYLDSSVDLAALAAETKNFSGAEIEGLVRSASSFALNRQVSIGDLAKPKELGEISVTKVDFEMALLEVKPAFGQHTDAFEQCIGRGIMPYSDDCTRILSTCRSLVDQVRDSEHTPLLSCLLSGPPGCGKTALTAHVAKMSDYPFVRRIAAESYVGYSEGAKIAAMTKAFEDAYKSPLSVIVLDDLERLMDYVRIGPRFSNSVLQALFALLKKQPPKAGRRLLIFATTSDLDFLRESELLQTFNVALQVPVLHTSEHFKLVLQGLPGFSPSSVDDICAALAGRRIGIRTLLLVAEMAVQRQSPVQKDTFLDCLEQAGSTA